MYKTDILFSGYYGHKNTGDDAFIEVAEWGAQTFWNKYNNRFLANKKNLPITTLSTKGYPFSIPKTYSLQGGLLIKNTDYLISAGGSTIHSKLPTNHIKSKAIQLKNKYNNIKIGGIGVSVGPFKSIKDEKAVEEYLKNIDFLALRDQTSFEYVESLNLPYTPINAFDLAALLPKIYNFKPNLKNVNEVKTIGVSVCPYESIIKNGELNIEKNRNEKTIRLLKAIDEKENVHFKFYVINGNERNGDYHLTLETIKNASPRSYEIIEYSNDTKKIWTSISNCDFIIATRLHAGIFACFSDTPFMLNEYHRKCTDFLNNIGYHNQYRLFNSEFDISQKADQVIEILNDASSYKKPKKVNKMIDLALLNFTDIIL